LNSVKSEIQIDNQIPSFTYFEADSIRFTERNLQNHYSTVFIHFNTTCEHCQKFANELYKNISNFSGTELLFISEESFSQLSRFRLEYKLDQFQFVKFLEAKNNDFYNVFKVSSVPAFIIYNKQKMLIKKINGEMKIDALIRNLN